MGSTPTGHITEPRISKMEGMPTIPGKDPEIMDSSEIAIAKRREKLNELLKNGDPFTGRFICSFENIACIANEIVGTERIPKYALQKGISGSKILAYGPIALGKDLSAIKPAIEKLKEKVEKFRIGYSLWEFTYSFEDYDEMIRTILEVLLDNKNEIEQ